MSEPLKPCPFCGDALERLNSKMVTCPTCNYIVTNETANTRASGWIKCSDRMPENNSEVLCVSRPHNVLFLAVWYENVWIGETYGTPTHWMPLPDPPKE